MYWHHWYHERSDKQTLIHLWQQVKKQKQRIWPEYERLFDEYDLKNNNNNEVGYIQTSRILRRRLKCSIKQIETDIM